MSAASEPARPAAVFRLPRTAYLLVVFLAAGVWPIALYGGQSSDGSASIAKLHPLVLLFLLPVLAMVFIARTATVVSAVGLTVRAVFGTRRLSWTDIRGLTVNGNSIYAVLADGAVRLPCVRIADLAAVSRASQGRLPQLPDAVARYAPSRRRR